MLATVHAAALISMLATQPQPARWVPDPRTAGQTQMLVPDGMDGCVAPNSSSLMVCGSSGEIQHWMHPGPGQVHVTQVKARHH